jgi:hypothetical protein
VTIAEIMEQAKALSAHELKELVKLLVDSLDIAEPESRHRRSIAELRGLGKEIWQGIDAQAYVNELHSEWGERR